MAHKHPWDPRLALPANVLSEPPGNRGSRITAQMPRKTYDAFAPYEDSYALPDYLEPPGTDARFSMPLPRKWIPGRITIGMPGLSGDQAVAAPNLGAEFGVRAAAALLVGLDSVPPRGRLLALGLAMDAIEPGLYQRFLRRLPKGKTDMGSIRKAIAAATAEGFTKELVAIGRGKAPEARSLAGLGCYGACAARSALGDFWEALATPFTAAWDGFTSVIDSKPVKWIAAGAAVIMPVTALGFGAQAIAPKETLELYKKGIDYAGKAVGAVASVACAVLQSPIAPIAAGAAAAAYGAPPQVGMIGAQIGQGLCPQGASAAPPPPPPPPPRSFPWVPVALGGGALLLILLATSPKKRSAEKPA